jgi:hypothetical protein
VFGRITLATLSIFVASGIAGCLDGPLDVVVDDPANLMPQTFRMEGTDCEEAGWIAHYAGSVKFAGVWESDDIREEYGNPIHDSMGLPTPLISPLYGNHHIGFNCKSAVVDGVEMPNYQWGFVGEQVKAPAWDPGGADRHILIGGISFQNGTIADVLRATTTADITHTLSAFTEWTIPRTQPRSFAYSEYHDLEKGIYQSWSTLEHLRDIEPRTVRFWWQVPADGSQAHIWSMDHDHDGADQPEGQKWNPVYWDMHTTGGGQWVTPKDGAGLQEHNFGLLPEAAGGTAEHYPPFSQPCLHAFYEHKTITFTSGKVFKDVLIDDLWAH